MARRRKKYKSTKCPEPLNSMIDIAGAFALGYIADKHRQKNGGKRNKVDPYVATGAAMGMGMLNSTEDLIRFGGVLGAMGAFDDDEPEQSWEFDGIAADGVKVNDNRYAWRLNCEDGSEYGICPEDYETRAAYNRALSRAKEDVEERPGDFHTEEMSELSHEEIEDMDSFLYCRVSRLDNGKNEHYRTENEELKIGSIVTVPAAGGTVQAVVLSVERHTRLTAPQPPERTEYIILD